MTQILYGNSKGNFHGKILYSHIWLKKWSLKVGSTSRASRSSSFLYCGGYAMLKKLIESKEVLLWKLSMGRPNPIETKPVFFCRRYYDSWYLSNFDWLVGKIGTQCRMPSFVIPNHNPTKKDHTSGIIYIEWNRSITFS